MIEELVNLIGADGRVYQFMVDERVRVHVCGDRVRLSRSQGGRVVVADVSHFKPDGRVRRPADTAEARWRRASHCS